MSSKASMESRIVTWFSTAPLATAETVLGIVKGVMKGRATKTTPITPPIRRKRRTKQEMAAARASVPASKGNKSTSFEPGELAQ